MRAVGWCYHFRVAYDNNLALRIPDELSTRYASADEMERGALEALALDEFRLGHLTRPELQKVLGFAMRGELDA